VFPLEPQAPMRALMRCLVLLLLHAVAWAIECPDTNPEIAPLLALEQGNELYGKVSSVCATNPPVYPHHISTVVA
jgi:hypothetical protein